MKKQNILLVIFMMTIAIAWLGGCQKKTGEAASGQTSFLAGKRTVTG